MSIQLNGAGATDEVGQWVSIKEKLPPLNKPVLYRTELYRSAGHYCGDGKWQYSGDGKELLPVLCWTALA